jgi:hypothetical protein
VYIGCKNAKVPKNVKLQYDKNSNISMTKKEFYKLNYMRGFKAVDKVGCAEFYYVLGAFIGLFGAMRLFGAMIIGAIENSFISGLILWSIIMGSYVLLWKIGLALYFYYDNKMLKQWFNGKIGGIKKYELDLEYLKAVAKQNTQKYNSKIETYKTSLQLMKGQGITDKYFIDTTNESINHYRKIMKEEDSAVSKVEKTLNEVKARQTALDQLGEYTKDLTSMYVDNMTKLDDGLTGEANTMRDQLEIVSQELSKENKARRSAVSEFI